MDEYESDWEAHEDFDLDDCDIVELLNTVDARWCDGNTESGLRESAKNDPLTRLLKPAETP